VALAGHDDRSLEGDEKELGVSSQCSQRLEQKDNGSPSPEEPDWDYRYTDDTIPSI